MPDRMAVPQPGPGEVLIKVAAAGVNRPDVLQRQGGYPPPPGATDVPGLEVAGEVVAVGDGCRALAVGDRVMALVAGGGYAEYCTRPGTAGPAGPRQAWTMVEAAAIPETFFTVWTNVFDRGRLQAGESFLVHGGSSGIGTTAIQLASRLRRHRVRDRRQRRQVRRLRGAGREARDQLPPRGFRRGRCAAETGGKGVDVILDMVGGDYVERNLQALAVEGRLVQIAWLQGCQGHRPTSCQLMVKRQTWTGSTLRPRSVERERRDRRGPGGARSGRCWRPARSGR